jgi:hypothetical protein
VRLNLNFDFLKSLQLNSREGTYYKPVAKASSRIKKQYFCNWFEKETGHTIVLLAIRRRTDMPWPRD